MSKESFQFIILLIITAVLLWFTIGAVDRAKKLSDLKSEAIQLGYAHHNPTNGQWQWKINSAQKIQ